MQPRKRKEIRQKNKKIKKSHQSECPLTDRFTRPVNASTIATVPSQHPTATVSPEGEYATLITAESTFSVDSSVPVSAFHTFKLLSQLPLTTCLPSGEKATDETLYLRGEESAQDAAQAKEGN